MRAVALVVLVAACGRISFDDVGTTDGGDGGATDASDGRVTTGPLGPRWITRYTDVFARITGANGKVAMVASYGGTLNVDNVAPLMGAAFTNSAVIRWDTDGTVLSSSLFENDGFCDMRGIELDGSDVIVAGFAVTTQTLASYQACAVSASRQQPILVRLDPATNTQTLIARWTAAGSNGQGWDVVRMPDGSFANAGIYGQSLVIGATSLPTATADPSLWVARTKPGVMNDATWAISATPATVITAGPLSHDGDELCMVGGFSGASNVFGTALPFVGGNYDAFVARLDAAGNPKFVRAIGSTGDESANNNGSIVATPDGGCLVGLGAPGDVTLDSTVYPATAGTGLAVHFSSTGTVADARRFASGAYVTTVGSRRIAAYRVAVPTMIGATMYTPDGSDVVIVELGASAAQDTLLGSVGGSGNQDARGIAAVAPDAVAVQIQSTGGLSFGSTSEDTAAGMGAVGVLGI